MEKPKLTYQNCVTFLGIMGVAILAVILLETCGKPLQIECSGTGLPGSCQEEQEKDIEGLGEALSDQMNPPTPITPGPGCQATYDLTGIWDVTYICSQNNQVFPEETERVWIWQNGSALTFDSADGSSFTGKVCGNKVDWTGGNANVYEVGIWTIENEEVFKKQSAYRQAPQVGGMRGSCEGEGRKQPAETNPLSD